MKQKKLAKRLKKYESLKKPESREKQRKRTVQKITNQQTLLTQMLEFEKKQSNGVKSSGQESGELLQAERDE